MSTVYNGKIHFTENELFTKYDRISLRQTIQTKLTFPYSKIMNYIHHTPIVYKTSMKTHYSDFNKTHDEDKKKESETNILRIEDWLDPVNDEYDFDYRFQDVENKYEVECEFCFKEDSVIHSVSFSVDSDKMELMNAVLKCILYGLKGGSEFLGLCSGIKSSDPEFLLKASLFCRREFNVRTVSNHLLALAASLPQCNIYLKKYFSTCINLPTDWIEVAQQYMIISNSIKLPAQLRRALVSKFKEFTTYQIGKYQHKALEVDIGSKKIKLTLKSLIRTLHISAPVDHVMCLLGKNYPGSNEEFVSSNLPGEWDQEKSGKRMKVPIPETWETQISINGNKPEVWEKLIDNKKLPYMAMIRNLRNILQANVNERHHDKVARMISLESKVINGKLLPFQYFTAFKVLEEYNDDISKAKEKLSALYVKSAAKTPATKTKGKFRKKGANDPNDKRDRIRKIVQLRKIMGRPLVSENIIQKYTKALNKAVEISTTYNIPCIRGRVLILSNIADETVYSKFKYGSSKSVKEVVALLTSLCYFASEYTEMGLVKESTVMFYKLDKKVKSILSLSSDILKQEIVGLVKIETMFEEMITKQRHFDLILLFDVSLPSTLLVKYTQSVNSSVTIFVNNIANATELYDCDNITSISGFNEHAIKIISEQSNGGFVSKVDSIDKRYNLESNVVCFPKIEASTSHDLETCEEIDSSKLTDVNVFISSTFLDMETERSLVNKVIIPAVKKELMMKNINFININCIDLRWGVPVHLGCSEQMMKYCIEQVKRCHIFIGILGARYGWIPDRDIIENLSDTYPELIEWESLSITQLEYKFAPINCHKIFMLQQLTDDSGADIRLEEFHNEIKNNEIFYEYSPATLLSDFKVLIPNISKIVCENYVGQDVTMSHICMKHQRVKRQKMIKHEVARFLEYATKNADVQDAVEENIALLENDLRIKVKLFNEKKNRDESSNIIDKKIIPIKEEATEKFGGIVLIDGKIGSGKTSIIAGLIREFRSPKYCDKYNVSGKLNRRDFSWFYDSIKHIYEENGQRVALYDLLFDMIEFLMLDLGYDFTDKLKHELGLYGVIVDRHEFWKPTDLRTALPVWTALLKIINMVDVIQITFFLDGVDELDDSMEACLLNWIPLSLSSKVRFVITATMESALSKCARLRNDCVAYEIKPISIKYKRVVIENMLMSQGKCLDSVPFNNHMTEFALKSDSDKPKYLKLAVNYLLQYATFDKVKETIRSMPSTVDALIMYTLKSLEKEIPKEICMTYFSFIRHSKSGLRNEDLQKLMSIYFQVAKKKNNHSVSRADFCDLHAASKLAAGFSLYPLMLIRNMSQSLIEEGRNQRISIKDKTVMAVISRYCDPINGQVIHYIISLYYDDLIGRTGDEVAYRDIIYHKYRSARFEECITLLTDFDYVMKRFDLSVAFGLLSDYIGYQDTDGAFKEQWTSLCQNDKFRDFKNFISKNFVFLTKNPELFIQQAINEPVFSHVHIACDNIRLAPYDFLDTDSLVLQSETINTCNDVIRSSVTATNNKITAVSWSPKMKVLALGCDSGLIQLFSSVTFQIIFNMRQHVLRVNALCFVEPSGKLVSVGEDFKALVWNTTDGGLLHELTGHTRSVTDCAHCFKAELICTTGLDAQCILWNQDSYKIHHTFKSGSPINCVTVHNSKVLIGCWDGSMIIYSVVDLVRTAVIHNCSSVRSVSINECYPTFLATNIEGHLSIWNANKGVKLKDFSTYYHRYPTCARFCSDGLKIIEYAGNNSQHQTASLWSTSVGYHENVKKIEDVCCIDSNSCFVVYGTRYGTVVVLDRLNLHLILTENVSDAELTAISINRSEKSFKNCFVVSNYYCGLQFFEIVNKSIVLKLKIENIHTRPIKSLVWSSYYIVTGSDDCSINIVNMKERSTSDFLASIKDIFLNSVLSVDVRKGRILAGSKDKSIGLFSISDRSILNRSVHAHDDWVTCVRFISSVSFVSASNDFAIKIWQMTMESTDTSVDDISRGDTLWKYSPTPVVFTVCHTLIGHMGLVTSLSFDNSELIASSSNDGTIKLWHLQGVFADNLVIDNNNAGSTAVIRDPIQWIKFHDTNGTMLALDAVDNLHTFDLRDRNCHISQLTSHQDPVTCAVDVHDTLYTFSRDTNLRQWKYDELLSKRMLANYRVINSILLDNNAGTTDSIVAVTDTGLLVFISYDIKIQMWQITDTVDIKVVFEEMESGALFTSPFLVCAALRQRSANSIEILFGQVTLCYQMTTKKFKKIKLEDTGTLEQLDIDCDDIQINENRFLKLIHNGTKRYFIRVAKNSQLLEMFSMNKLTKELIKLTMIPLNGHPCHMLVFKTIGGDHVCFVAYEQGTVDFITIKKIN